MNVCKNRKKICIIVIIVLVIFGGMTAVGINNYSKNYGYANELIKAMDNDDIDKFNKLLNQKGNINSNRSMFSFFESNDMSPIRYACWLNKFEFVEPLLIKGADPNLEKKGKSVLTLCFVNATKDTEEEMLNTMKLLIEYGTDVNYKEKEGVSVLSRAELYLNVVYNTISEEIKCEVFKLLIDSGVTET